MLNENKIETNTYKEAQNIVGNLPIPLEDRRHLSELIFDIDSVNSDEFGNFNVKYYRAGFCDAVNLIFDAKEFK